MPKELITPGARIKKKKLENNLFQKDVGKIIGTDNFTIGHPQKPQCNLENTENETSTLDMDVE